VEELYFVFRNKEVNDKPLQMLDWICLGTGNGMAAK
jgi:hypothetical protein